jgi:hypothetical protein
LDLNPELRDVALPRNVPPLKKLHPAEPTQPETDRASGRSAPNRARATPVNSAPTKNTQPDPGTEVEPDDLPT